MRRHAPTSSGEVKAWLKEESRQAHLQVERIAFHQSGQWQWDERGFWTHVTKRFFSVAGVRYFSIAHGRLRTQPIIDQSEIGLLSFLVSRRNGEWWILAHAKVEPGNVNGTQLAPTVQATRSNYEAVHGGQDTPYLKLAQSAEGSLCHLLQSEQNSRFLAKRNRNSVVLLSERVTERDSRFKWMRVTECLTLLSESHTVNTDARSVLVCWLFTDRSALRECLVARSPWAARLIPSLESGEALYSEAAIEDWLAALDDKWRTNTEIIPLRDLEDSWQCRESEISSPDDPSLLIYQIDVHCARREVPRWDQPIAGSRTCACMILLIGDAGGTLHLLLQAALEVGNRSGFELTTTVQAESCDTVNPHEQPYLKLAETSGRTLCRFQNSEEGGRFDRCVSEYRIVWIEEISEEQEGPFHRWVSLAQFSNLLGRENRITNELRSAVSCLLGIDHG
jgi:oxidase EvaA